MLCTFAEQMFGIVERRSPSMCAFLLTAKIYMFCWLRVIDLPLSDLRPDSPKYERKSGFDDAESSVFSCPRAASGASQPCRLTSSNTAASSSSSPPRGLRHTPTLQRFPPPPQQLLEPQAARSAPIPVSLYFILDLFSTALVCIYTLLCLWLARHKHDVI